MTQPLPDMVRLEKKALLLSKQKKTEITGVNPNGALSQNDLMERKLTELELQKAKQNLALAYVSDASQYEVAKLALSKKSDSLKALAVTGIKLNALEKQSVELARLNKLNAEPKIYLGNNAGGKISLDYLKTVKEINLSPGYSFVSGTIWMQGQGFDKSVVSVSLNSASLTNAQSYFNRCKAGAQIIFDNIQVKDKNGVQQTLKSPPAFIVYDQQSAEASSTLLYNDDKVFTQVEQGPQFTGGEPAWRKYLIANLKAAIPVDEGWKAGKYVIIVKFIVHTDGTVSDVTTENYAGSKTALHCIEVIKNAPKWQPAVQNGRKVNAYKKQPITFVIEE
jgi:hypothetical protein